MGPEQHQSVELVNLSETLRLCFTLVKPSLESLASQIVDSQSLDNLKYSTDRKYTSELLLNAIEDALKKAENQVSSPPEGSLNYHFKGYLTLPSIPQHSRHLACEGLLLGRGQHASPPSDPSMADRAA